MNIEEENGGEKLKESLIDINATDYFSYERSIEIIGDFGVYQVFMLIYLGLIWVIVPSTPLMIPYYRMIPRYSCLNNNTSINFNGEKNYFKNSTDFHICTLQEYCDNNIKKFGEIEIITWESDFKINCLNSVYYGFLASFYFIGILVGFLFVANFSDKYGRKKVLIFFLWLYFFISILIMIFQEIYLLFMYLFMVGIIYSGTSMCAFVLAFESTSKKYKTKFTTIISMSFGIGALFNIFLFYYFQNWKYILGTSIFICFVLMLLNFRIKESPELLFNKKRYAELEEVLDYIAKINNREQHLQFYKQKYSFIFSTNEKHNIKNIGVLQLLHLSKERFKLLIMCLNWFVMTLSFYGMNFNLNNFGLNIYLTGFIIYSSEIIAQFSSMFLVEKIGDKNSVCAYYLLTGISLVLINFIPKIGLFQFINTLFIFLGKFGISAINNVNYIYSARIFPVHMRMGALSFCKIISRFGAISSTLILEISPYSMVMFGSLCLMASLLVFYNEDTE